MRPATRSRLQSTLQPKAVSEPTLSDTASGMASAEAVSTSDAAVNNGSSTEAATTNLEYATLLQIGVNYCQLFGGMLWTDYNEHDPGLTTLEQLVYAVTDILYRANFPVADILAEQPLQAKPGRTTLFTGNLALTGNPLTIDDYRKYLYDAMRTDPTSNFKNAWLVPVTDDPSGIAGLYDVLVETFVYHQDPSQDQAMLAQIALHYQAARNLTEDIRLPITIMAQFPVEVSATIDIAATADPNQVLANVLFQLQNFLVPFVNVMSIDKLMQDGVPCDLIYEGPLLERGVIADDQFSDILSSVSVRDMENVILGVVGVLDVKDLTLNGQSRGAVKIPATPTQQVPRLTPSIFVKQASYPFTLTCNGVTVQTDPNQVYADITAQLVELESDPNYQVQTTENATYCTLPQGEFRDIASYFSIQRQYPQTYGIGEAGILLSQTISEKTVKKRNLRTAQAQQLKAYLLFFEQLLTDCLAQLANAARLFSLDETLERSYFWQSLVQPAIGPPYIVEQKLLVAPPIPPCSRFVVYVSMRCTPAVLRSPGFVNLADANASASAILTHGQHAQAYKIRGLPNGQVQILLEDPCCKKLAFGCQRYASQCQAQEVIKALAAFMVEMANNPMLQAEYISIAAQGAKDASIGLCNTDSEVYPDGAVAWYLASLNRLVKRHDPFYRRRNRFLDNLLARFGQHFDDALLAAVDTHPAQFKDNFLQDLIDWKIGYLRHFVKSLPVPDTDTDTNNSAENGDESGAESLDQDRPFVSPYALGGERGKGLDPLLPASMASGNLSGLQYRLTWLLGLAGSGLRNSNNVVTDYEYVCTNTDVEDGLASSLRSQWPHAFIFQSRHQSVMKSLLIYGTDADNYSIAEASGNDEASGWQVLFKWPDEPQAHVVYSAATPGDAQAAIDGMVHYMMDYCANPQNHYAGEELFVIDHILLRPRGGNTTGSAAALPGSFYSFRVSVIYPDWPSRFQDEVFHELAYTTLLANCPAHIAAHNYWLNSSQMTRFKQLHAAWEAQLAKPAADPNADSAALDQAASSLAGFIDALDGHNASH